MLRFSDTWKINKVSNKFSNQYVVMMIHEVHYNVPVIMV